MDGTFESLPAKMLADREKDQFEVFGDSLSEIIEIPGQSTSAGHERGKRLELSFCATDFPTKYTLGMDSTPKYYL